MALTPGIWGSLPDFGITEKLFGDKSNIYQNVANYGNVEGVNRGAFDYSKAPNIPEGTTGNSPASVLGAKTSNVSVYNWEPPADNSSQQSSPQNNSSGGIPGVDMRYYQGWNDQNAIIQDWNNTWQQKTGGGNGAPNNDAIMNQINSGYGDYFSKLNDMYGGLESQANAQSQIAQNSYGQSVKDLNANRQSSLQDLGLTEQKLQNNQVKNLRDIASNIQNQYMAGNVMLGSRGAGDSSAANQYGYALTREASKLRGDVVNQTAQSQAEIENNKAKLNNIVTQETSRLDTELANVKQSISSWLAEQQNAIKGMIADGTLRKSQDIASASQNALNQALSAYERKQSEIANQRGQLETWAMNNASNISQLRSNMSAIGQFAPQMAQAGSINGSPTIDSQGNLRSLYGYRSGDDERRV